MKELLSFRKIPVSSRTVEVERHEGRSLQEWLLAVAVAIWVQAGGFRDNRVQGEAVARAPTRFRPLIESRRKSTRMRNVKKRGTLILLVVLRTGGGRLPYL